MIINKIKINGNDVEIVLDEWTLKISIETYLNGHFLVGEEIDDLQIKKIRNDDYINKIKKELLDKLSRKKLSKKECKKFLIEHLIDEESTDKIICEYEKNYLINDFELAESLLNQCLLNKKGLNIFKQKLIDRDIFINYDAFLDKCFDKEKYDNNIKYLVSKYIKLAKNKSNIALKQYLKNKLIENGYNIEEFIYYCAVETVNEQDIVEGEIDKFFKNKEINAENIAKITKKLLSKGFNYDIIKKSIRECELNETN